jgi:hypothetical protein
MCLSRRRFAACVVFVLSLALGGQLGLPAGTMADTADNGGIDPPMPPGDVNVPGGPTNALLDMVVHFVPSLMRLAMI